MAGELTDESRMLARALRKSSRGRNGTPSRSDRPEEEEVVEVVVVVVEEEEEEVDKGGGRG